MEDNENKSIRERKQLIKGRLFLRDQQNVVKSMHWNRRELHLQSTILFKAINESMTDDYEKKPNWNLWGFFPSHVIDE